MKEKTGRKSKKKLWIVIAVIVVVLFALIAPQGYNIYMGTFTFGITTEMDTQLDNGLSSHFVKFGKLDSRTSQKGSFEKVTYETTGSNGNPATNYVQVYLPYGYDAERNEPYNILYFQHGAGSDQEIFTAATPKNWLDNLFASGVTEPMILVFSSTYSVDEYLNDIIPTVEARYNTYAKDDVSEANLIATRDHRGMSGYSMGCGFTWTMFRSEKGLDYFKWWSPMSMGCTGPGDRVSGDLGEQAYESLKPAIDAHPDRDFFIYCATGDEKADGVGTPLRTEIPYLAQQTEFQYGTNIEAGDNLYLLVTDFKHTDLVVPYAYYNSLQVLFR